jgi:archaellin
LDVLAKTLIYIFSAAGGYPIPINLDETTILQRMKNGQERLEYAKQFKTIYIAAN